MAKMTADEFKKLVYSATKATVQGVNTAAKQVSAQSNTGGQGGGGSSSMSYQPPKPKVILPGVKETADIFGGSIYEFINNNPKAKAAYMQPMRDSRADIYMRAQRGEAVYPQRVSYDSVLNRDKAQRSTPLSPKSVNNSLRKSITSSADSFLDAYEKKLEKDIDELKKEKRTPDIYIDKWQAGMEGMSNESLEKYRENLKESSRIQEQIAKKEAQFNNFRDSRYYGKKNAERVLMEQEAINNGSFSANAQTGKNMEHGTIGEYPTGRISLSGDRTQRENINPLEYTNTHREEIENTTSHKYKRYLTATEKERDIYSFYLATDKDKAQKYLDLIQPELDRRYAEVYEAEKKDFGEQHPILGSIESVPMTMTKGISALETWAQDIKNKFTGEYEPVNQYSDAFLNVKGANALREGAAENINSGIGKFLYNVGMSMTDFLILSPLGPTASLTVMSLSSAGETANDALARGASPEQASQMAFVAGAAEFAFSKIPVDNLYKLINAGDARTLKNVLKSGLKQGLGEGTEEVLTDAVNSISDEWIMKEKSNFNLNVASYMQQGMSREEAISLAQKDLAKDFSMSFAGGFISGGTMGSGATIISGSPNIDTVRKNVTEARQGLSDAVYKYGGTSKQAIEAKAKYQNALQKQAKIDADTINSAAQKNGRIKQNQDTYSSSIDLGGNMGYVPGAAYSVSDANDSHTPEMRKIINEYKGAVDTGLADFYQKAVDGELPNSAKYELKPVSDRAVLDIKKTTGVDTAGFTVVLNSEVANHINARHGESGKADHSMKDINDISRIQYVLDNYDSMQPLDDLSMRIRNSDGSSAKQIKYSKRINGTYYIVQAVPNSKAKTIFVRTAYLSKANKKGNVSQMRSDAQGPKLTSKNGDLINTFPSNNNIPQNSEYIKGLKAAGFDIEKAKGAAPKNIEYLKALKAKGLDIGNIDGAVDNGRADTQGPGLTSKSVYTNNTVNENIAPEKVYKKTDSPLENMYDVRMLGGGETAVSGVMLEVPKSDIRMAQRLGELTGKGVVFYSRYNDNGMMQNGYYKDGKIHINAKSGDTLAQIFSHELTHGIEGTKAHGDFQKLIFDQIGDDLDTMRQKKAEQYEKGGIHLDGPGIDAEIVAEYTATRLFTDEGAITQAMQSNRGLMQKIKNWLDIMIAKVTGNKEKEFLLKAQSLYAKALEQSRKGNEGIKFSIKEDPSIGRYVKVDTEQERFDGLTTAQMQKEARNVILEKFKGKVIGTDNRAYVNRDTAREFSYPANRRMDRDVKEAKMKSSPELDNLLQVSEYIEHRNDDGRHSDATGGWDIYKTKFNVDGKFFEGEISIKLTDKGRVFYDVTKIRDITKNPQLDMGNPHTALSNSNVSNESIHQNGSNGKVQYSVSEYDGEILSRDVEPTERGLRDAVEEAEIYDGLADTRKTEIGRAIDEIIEEGTGKKINKSEKSPFENDSVKILLSEEPPLPEPKLNNSYDWAQNIRNKGVGNHKDLSRNLDEAAGKSRELRSILRKEIETPFYEATKSYAQNVQKQFYGLHKEMKKLGIKKGSKESAAVMWYGEGRKQALTDSKKKNRNKQVNIEYTDYTLQDLKRDFPKNWQNIVDAEKYFRKTYDDYVGKMNKVLEEIYPDVLEEAQEKLSRYQSNVKYYDEQIKAKNQLKRKLLLEMAKMEGRMKEGDIEVTKESIEKLSDRIEKIQNRISRYKESQQRYRDGANKINKEIESGDVIRNKRLLKRKDYFRHFQDMESGFGALANIITTPSDIDTSLAGVSEFTKPNTKWAEFLQARKDGAYVEDAVGGLLGYIEKAEYKIAIDPMIAKGRAQVRAMAKATEETRNANKFIEWYSDWLNDLAGKTNPIDRVIPKIINRKTVRVLKWLNGRVKANAVVGNARSMVAQFFNLPNAAAYIKDPIAVAKGMKLYGAMFIKSADAVALMNQSGFLTQRYLDDYMSKFDTGVLKVPEKFANWMLTLGDKETTKLIWAAAYEQGVRKKVDSPIEYADDIARRSVAGRGIGEVPLTQKSEIVKFVAPFQVEVNNQWQLLKEMVKGKNVVGLINLSILSYLMNAVARELFGFDVSFDPINAVKDAIEDIDDEENIAMNIIKGMGRVTGEVLSNVPGGSMIAGYLFDETQSKAMFGESDPTRFGTGNIGLKAFFDPIGKAISGQEFSNESVSAILNIAFPYGGRQIERLWNYAKDAGYMPRTQLSISDGWSAYKQTGGASFTDNGSLRFPIDMSDPKEAVMSAAFGPYSTERGRKYIDSNDKPLSAQATETYKYLTENGADGGKVFDTIKSINKAKKGEEKRKILSDSKLDNKEKAVIYRDLLLDKESAQIEVLNKVNDMGKAYVTLSKISDIGGEEGGENRTARKRDEIYNSNLSDADKEMIYLDVITTKDNRGKALEKVNALKKTGFDINDVMEISNKFSEYNEMKDIDRDREFSHWLNKQGYTSNQIGTVKDNFTYMNIVPVDYSEDAYNKTVDIGGIDPDKAYDLTQNISDLDPMDGDDKVKDKQKYLEIVNSNMSETEQRNALNAIMNKNSLDKYNSAMNAGIKSKDYINYKADTSLFESDKDENGNTVKNSLQSKVLTYIDNMPLTEEQKNHLYFEHNYAESKLYEAPWYGGARYDGYIPSAGSYTSNYRSAEKKEDPERVQYSGSSSKGTYKSGYSSGKSSGRKSGGGSTKAAKKGTAQPTVKLSGAELEKAYNQILRNEFRDPVSKRMISEYNAKVKRQAQQINTSGTGARTSNLNTSERKSRSEEGAYILESFLKGL